MCHLPDSVNIPLSQLQSRLPELDSAVAAVSPEASGGVKGRRSLLCFGFVKMVHLNKLWCCVTVDRSVRGVSAWH
jgi:hypothetical protein